MRSAGMQGCHRSRRCLLHLSFLLAAWLLMASFGSFALATDGDLDPAFGADGKITTTFPGGAFAGAVAVQPDGGIVVAGAAAGQDRTGVFAVARYGMDGSLDPAFGDQGRVTTAIGAGGDEGRSIGVQPDGKIVVAGTTERDRFALARYTTNGVLDPTFGTGGIVTTDFTRGDDIAYDMAIQPDGKIVAVGSAGNSRPTFALARYETDGSLDPMFGGDGTIRTKFGLWGQARALALQPNGKLVVVGFNGSGFALARYLPDGSLDPSFGHGGKVGNSFPLGFAGAVIIQPDRRILVGGDLDIFHFALARYRADGRLDRTFGGDGRVTTDVGSGEQAVASLVIQPSGRILAAGRIGPHEYGDPIVWRFALTRYRANGVLDRSFGGDGKVFTRFKGGAFASGAAAQPGGRIVVVGGAGQSNSDAFAVARYLV